MKKLPETKTVGELLADTYAFDRRELDVIQTPPKDFRVLVTKKFDVTA
jgi:hypothetical protein